MILLFQIGSVEKFVKLARVREICYVNLKNNSKDGEKTHVVRVNVHDGEEQDTKEITNEEGEKVKKSETKDEGLSKLNIDSFQAPTSINEGDNIEIKCHVASKYF